MTMNSYVQRNINSTNKTIWDKLSTNLSHMVYMI